MERDASTPSYSADYLAELKNATPQARAPRWEEQQDDNGDGDSHDTSTDIASKFGADLADSPSTSLLLHTNTSPDKSAIPSSEQIREKIQRRRRLAHEQKASEDFISLADDGNPAQGSDSDDNAGPYGKDSLVRPAEEVDLQAKYGSSRLERDDEDFAEGFDEYVEDAGNVVLSRAGKKQQDDARRRDIAAQIASAEGVARQAKHRAPGRIAFEEGDATPASGANDQDTDDDTGDAEDADEAAQTARYAAAQLHAGTYSARHTTSTHKNSDIRREEAHRVKMAALSSVKARPIPDLRAVARRYRERVAECGERVRASQTKLQGLTKEREDIAKEEEWIRGALKEAGKKLERLRGGAGTDVERKRAGEVEDAEITNTDTEMGDNNASPSSDASTHEEEEGEEPDTIPVLGPDDPFGARTSFFRAPPQLAQSRGLDSLGGMSAVPKDDYDV